MKALFIALTLLATSFSVHAASDGDADNTKLRMSLIADQSTDCKISLREISRYDGYTVGKRYICIYLAKEDGEMSLLELATMAKANEVKFEYAGNSEKTLLSTLQSWRKFLIVEATEYSDNQAGLEGAKQWSFDIESRTGNTTVVTMTNRETEEVVRFSVEMNKKINTDKK